MIDVRPTQPRTSTTRLSTTATRQWQGTWCLDAFSPKLFTFSRSHSAFIGSQLFLRSLSEQPSKYTSHQRHVFIRIYEAVHIFRMTRIFKPSSHLQGEAIAEHLPSSTLADDFDNPLPPSPPSLPTSLPCCTPRTGKALQAAGISLAFFGKPNVVLGASNAMHSLHFENAELGTSMQKKIPFIVQTYILLLLENHWKWGGGGNGPHGLFSSPLLRGCKVSVFVFGKSRSLGWLGTTDSLGLPGLTPGH